MQKFILVYIISTCCCSILLAQGENGKVRAIDSIVHRIDTDILVAKFFDEGKQVAFYKDGKLAKFRNSILHVGVKTFDYYYLNDKVILLHITQTMNKEKVVDTYYYLEKKKIITRKVLGSTIWGNDKFTSKQIIEQAKRHQALLY